MAASRLQERGNMKKYLRYALTVVLALSLVGGFGLVGCSQQSTSSSNTTTEKHDSVKLQIFAANSLSKAMNEVQELYTKSHSWVTFADTQYLSSGDLNAQLQAGAYADILISASKSKMDDAAKANLIDPSSRFDMFKNDLVIVTAEKSSITSVTLEDIAAGKYTVAVGDESVPAGNYAAQSLYTVGLYSAASGTGGTFTGALAPAGKVLLDSSVGNVAKHAQSGDVDIAFVYSSDVYRLGNLKVVGTVAPSTHKDIIYPAAVTTQSKYAQESKDFLSWAITDPEAIKVWQKWGFELVS